MRRCFTQLILFSPVVCSLATSFSLCLSGCSNTIPISIDEAEKTIVTNSYDALFNFKCAKNYFIGGVSFEIINNEHNWLQISDSTLQSDNITLKISLTNIPITETTYNFGINFIHNNKRDIWVINGLKIIYKPQPQPIKPSIKCTEYTEATAHLIDNIKGGIEVRFSDFTYSNIPSLDNLTAIPTFNVLGANFTCIIDPKKEGSFDVIVKSDDIKQTGTITGSLTFYYNGQLVDYKDDELSIDIFNPQVNVPDDYYSYYDYESLGRRWSIVTGFSKDPLDSFNCISIPSEHIVNNQVYRVRSVGKMAFFNVDAKYPSLKYLDFNRAVNLEKIDDAAFAECDYLVGDLNFPRSLKEIGQSAFSNCSSLGNALNIFGTLGLIGISAFENCKNISKINICEYRSNPSWLNYVWDIHSKEWTTNKIFSGISSFGSVYVYNKTDEWKDRLTKCCSLPSNWLVLPQNRG